MMRRMKVSMIVGAVLIGIGLVMMAVSLGTAGIDGLDTAPCVTNIYEIGDDFRDLDISVDTANVSLVPSEDGVCKVVCLEEEKLYHTVSVRDGVLEIRRVDERAWFDNIGIHIGEMQVTVYLPQAEYGKLTVNGSTGWVDIPEEIAFESIDVTVSTGNVHNGASASDSIRIRASTGGILIGDVTADSMELSVSTGRIDAEKIVCDGELRVTVTTGGASLTGIRCRTFFSEGSTGKLGLSDVIAAERMDIRRTTGAVEMRECDAGMIVIKTSTGDVTGSLLTGKLFDAQTSTGDIQIPMSASGGECRITTSTGDIRIEIE